MKQESKIIILKDFHATKLNNNRDIYIYLPPNYDKDKNKYYPVLYMHDGQNLFYTSKSFTGSSWNMKTTTDRLINERKIEEIIIVGISNTQDRWSEYTHYMSQVMVLEDDAIEKVELDWEVKGILYEDFLINDLKPYIDEHFRTLKDKENTALMGSSMGGLVTFNIGFRHPEVFSKLGIMSPAFHWSNSKTFNIKHEPLKIWMDAGEYENNYVENSKKAIQILLNKGYIQGKDLFYYEHPKAVHSEISWADRVELPLLYLFGKIGKVASCELFGRNVIGLKEMKQHINTVTCYDSGFKMSDMVGNYIVLNPEIIEIKSDGTITPKACGSTKVIYSINGIKTIRTYSVIEELSDYIKITVNLKTPENTPLDDKICIHLNVNNLIRLNKVNDRLYRREILIQRDWKVPYGFSRGKFGTEAIDENGSFAYYGVIDAKKDEEINYEVFRWMDL